MSGRSVDDTSNIEEDESDTGMDSESFQPIRVGWFTEIISQDNPRKGWEAVLEFGGETVDSEELIGSTAASGENFNQTNKVSGEVGQKSAIEPVNYNFSSNKVWVKLEKYAVICTMPDLTRGYPVDDNKRQRAGNPNEIVFKNPLMIDFWREFTANPTAFPPEDPDAARILEYLVDHWDAYTNNAGESEGLAKKGILEIDPKEALVAAVAGRHAEIEDPTVVFKKINSKDTDLGRVFELNGELTASNIEIEDPVGLDIELSALLRMFTINSCLQKVVWEQLSGEREEAILEAADAIEVQITPRPEEDVIEFGVEFGPQHPGTDR